MRWVAWIAGLLAACDGGDVGDGGKDTDAAVDDTDSPSLVDTVTFEGWCGEASEAYRAWLASCLGEAAYPAEGRFDEIIEEGCLQTAESVASGRITFDGAAARACLDAIVLGSCEWSFSPFYHPECVGLFAPTVEPGGSCYHAAGRAVLAPAGECIDSYCSDDACPGTCTPWPAEGGACGDVGGRWVGCDPVVHFCDADSTCQPLLDVGAPCPVGGCGSDSECRDVDGTYTCVAIARPGESCSDALPCSPPIFRCDDDGVCRIKVDEGESCLMAENCVEGQVCRDADGEGPDGSTCEQPAPNGQPCLAATDCAGGLCLLDGGAFGACADRLEQGVSCMGTAECATGLWCRYTPEGVGSCQPAGSDGAGCRSYGFPSLEQASCAAGLTCMADGVCHPPGGEGDPCHPFVVTTCPTGLTCDRASATCQAPAADTEACTPTFPSACEAGLGCACAARDTRCFQGVTIEPQAWHVCRPLVAEGGDCWLSEECELGSCARHLDGEPVLDDQPGRCDADDAPPECTGP